MINLDVLKADLSRRGLPVDLWHTLVQRRVDELNSYIAEIRPIDQDTFGQIYGRIKFVFVILEVTVLC